MTDTMSMAIKRTTNHQSNGRFEFEATPSTRDAMLKSLNFDRQKNGKSVSNNLNNKY